jgi:hypothetical protein
LIAQNGTARAGSIWNWRWGRAKDEIDVGQVARSLTKEVMGARDIFESIASLSEGKMTDRLEYVRLVASNDWSTLWRRADGMT